MKSIDLLFRHIQTASRVAQRHRLTFFTLGMALLLIGGFIALTNLDLKNKDLLWPILIANFILGAAGAITLNALSLANLARLLKSPLSFYQTIKISSLATVSNVLPFPAGIAYHTYALQQAGNTVSKAAAITGLGSLSFISISLLIVGLFMLQASPIFALFSCAIGAISIIGTAWYLIFYSGFQRPLILEFFLLRAARFSWMILRIHFWLMAIGAASSFQLAAGIAGATAAGTAMTVFPAGLGISEVFAAGVAGLLKEPSSTAFVVAALNRVSILVLSGAVYLLCSGFYYGNEKP